MTATLNTGKPRIIGTFIKQVWGGRKNNEAIHSAEEEFDATNAVLLLPHAELIALEDSRVSTDTIGEHHVGWDGPFEVRVVDSILEFFEVDELDDITSEMLEAAKADANPKPVVHETLTLTIKVSVTRSPEATIKEFIENLDYSISSNTVGVVVKNTEIIDSE